MLLFYASDQDIAGIAQNETMKIKFEVDTDPPDGAGFERKYRLLPAPYDITLYDYPSLFAGKVHALLCRAWQNRVKGRDLYDYVFYISRGASLNTEHLKARLVQSGAWNAMDDLTINDIKKLLYRRFDTIDYKQAKDDVSRFVKDTRPLDLWSSDFFRQITEELH